MQYYAGGGNARFDRLAKAAQAGQIVPPADLRYLRKAASDITAESATGRILTYLQQLYESVAETMPDFRGDDSVETQVEFLDGEPDPYAIQLLQRHDGVDDNQSGVPAVVTKKRRNLKSVVIQKGMVAEQEERFLPPGASMRDYWEQMQNENPAEKVSFCQFWRAPCFSTAFSFSFLKPIKPWHHIFIVKLASHVK